MNDFEATITLKIKFSQFYFSTQTKRIRTSFKTKSLHLKKYLHTTLPNTIYRKKNVDLKLDSNPFLAWRVF